MGVKPVAATGDRLAMGEPSRVEFVVWRDFERRWDRGERPRAEEYAALLDSDQPDALLELAYHEFCRLEEAGEHPDHEPFLRRFPSIRERLQRLLALHDAIDDRQIEAYAEREADFPEAGDELGPYRLVREIGRGGLARVFLAEETELERRLVVVKVSRRVTVEPWLLARLRHPNIIEIWRHATTEDESLQILCMPLLGGATLASLLAACGRPRRVEEVFEALDRIGPPEYGRCEDDSATRRQLGGWTLPQAAVWWIARLAEALDHARVRGVSHGDLKPANILIAADGRPILLDFNLASDSRGAGSDESRVVGTLAYMSPERLCSLEAGTPCSPRIDDRHRADLYSLGLVLLEMLTGRVPGLPPGTRASPERLTRRLLAVRRRGVRIGREVPASLRPILRRLMDPVAVNRYQRGIDLAEDLDRWSAGCSPRHVSRPRLIARGLSAVARHRGLAAVVLLVVACCAATVGVCSHLADAEARRAASAVYDRIADGREPGVFRFTRASGWSDVDPEDRAKSARELLDRYGVLGHPGWRGSPMLQSLPEAERLDFESLLLEQLWRATCAEYPGSETLAVSRSTGLLNQTDGWLGLAAFEQVVARSPSGETIAAPGVRSAPAPAPWLDAYLLGVKAETQGQYREAWGYYRVSLVHRPEAYWPKYRSAVAAYRLGLYREASDQLGACLRQRPGNAAIHAQRAACLAATGEIAQAIAHCDRALQLDPRAHLARLNRGFMRAGVGATGELLSELERLEAESRYVEQGDLWRLRLEVMTESGVPIPLDSADGISWRLVAERSGEPDLQFHVGMHFYQDRQWEVAREHFGRVLASCPEHMPAILFRAESSRELGLWSAAYFDYRRLSQDPRYPGFVHLLPVAARALHQLALGYGTSGVNDQALEHANRAIELCGSNPGMLAESYFVLASVKRHALESGRTGIEDVIGALRTAYSLDPQSLLADDRFFRSPDFVGLHDAVIGQIALSPEGRLFTEAAAGWRSRKAPTRDRKPGIQPGPTGPGGNHGGIAGAGSEGGSVGNGNSSGGSEGIE